ncbi:hypothetical protein Y032_0679g1459 [Ancylostoma ceylanicum]|uniref:Uncharacterized protein n=1 Tax=Ancylostoma ceylanicum TaxID=53326 RepID=A0A016WHJ5_9BILA|nr:hypothetical protein Y032_0679g1459 [Ancylostoma ceylanicum]
MSSSSLETLKFSEISNTKISFHGGGRSPTSPLGHSTESSTSAVELIRVLKVRPHFNSQCHCRPHARCTFLAPESLHPTLTTLSDALIFIASI